MIDRWINKEKNLYRKKYDEIDKRNIKILIYFAILLKHNVQKIKYD